MHILQKVPKTYTTNTSRHYKRTFFFVFVDLKNIRDCGCSRQITLNIIVAGQMQHLEISQNKLPGETVLKARIANHAEQDFIEVELDNSQKTFRALVELLCAELSVDPVAVIKVRKLPNTILRKDKDIARLRDYHEIELVLEQNTCLSPSKNYVQSQDQMPSAINGKLLY